MIPFDTRAYHAQVDAGDTILSLAERLAKYGGGGTDCSIPLHEANTKHRKRKSEPEMRQDGKWAQNVQRLGPLTMEARAYGLERIKDIRAQISETGMEVATITQQESGLAMQLRFQSINAELARFSARMEDLERRAWAITAKWLAMSEEPLVAWPRDFNLADPAQELSLLRDMQETAMPQPVIIEQQKRIVKVQFDGSDQETQDQLITSLNADKSQL